MEQRKITIKDVSERAGVSTATVSRVLTGIQDVSEDVRRKVFEAVKDLNYQPNRTGKAQRKNESRRVGILLPDFSRPYYAQLAEGLERSARKNGLRPIIAATEGQLEIQANLIGMLVQEEVAGILMVPVSLGRDSVGKPTNTQVPVVCIDRPLDSSDRDLVTIEGYAGSRKAVNYLAGLGHEKVALISGPESDLEMAERKRGYLDASHDSRGTPRRGYVCIGEDTRESGREAMHTLLSLDDPPTAVLVASGEMTLGGILAIRERKISIPKQLSVIGFEDADWAAIVEPPLTSIALPALELGEKAIDVFLERQLHPDFPWIKLALAPRLVSRASCSRIEDHRSV